MSEPYDVHAALRNPSVALTVALGRWETRADDRAPDARRAANDAMDAIDAMLAELHALRARLHIEIRAADDANDARVDAMLADSGKDTL